MSDILEELIAIRRNDALERKNSQGGRFGKAIAKDGISIIAELKKASPSEGLIRGDFKPLELAKSLEEAGAAALSVLCEPHRFMGSEEYLRAVRANTKLPLLYKDFISTPRQIAEAFAAGANAVLLIAAALEKVQLENLIVLAHEIGLDALVETHSEKEIDLAIDCGARIIGVNCRNLRNFSCDVTLLEKLLAKIPRGFLKVAESGMHDAAAIARARDAGADAFLVGTALMRSDNPGEALAKILSNLKNEKQ